MRTYIGTSGFTLQAFYPSTLESSKKLSFYARTFPTVEINSTFYHLPRQTTIINWQKAVPQKFVFAFKVFQEITHTGLPYSIQTLLSKWFSIFEPFATINSQHLMLFQFPASYPYDQQKLTMLLHLLPQTYKYAFEFRHPSWFVDEVYQQVLAKRGTIVLADNPLRNTMPLWPIFDLLDASFTYIRFHGAPKLYYSSYSSSQLHTYVNLIRHKLATQNVYGYFNNDAASHAASNAKELTKLISIGDV